MDVFEQLYFKLLRHLCKWRCINHYRYLCWLRVVIVHYIVICSVNWSWTTILNINGVKTHDTSQGHIMKIVHYQHILNFICIFLVLLEVHVLVYEKKKLICYRSLWFVSYALMWNNDTLLLWYVVPKLCFGKSFRDHLGPV